MLAANPCAVGGGGVEQPLPPISSQVTTESESAALWMLLIALADARRETLRTGFDSRLGNNFALLGEIRAKR